MPDPRPLQVSSLGLTPEEVASRSFATVRRGLDPETVRRFLDEVSGQLRSARAREAELLDLLADAEARASSPVLDEVTLSAAVGSETAKVLQAAHSAAQEVVAKAQARAASVLEEADSLHETRAAAAEREVARLLSEGKASVELLVEQTKEECRAMLAEARGARREILADLAGRRRELHHQLEQLRAAKDALAGVVDGVIDSVGTIRARLAGSEEEAREAAEEVLYESTEGGVEELEIFDHENGSLLEASSSFLEEARAEAPVAVNVPVATEEPSPVASDATAPLSSGGEALVDVSGESAGQSDLGAALVDNAVEELESIVQSAKADSRQDEDPSADATSTVDALFARIRATRADEVSEARSVLDAAEHDAHEAVEDPGTEATATDSTLAEPRDEAATESAEAVVDADAGEEGADGTLGELFSRRDVLVAPPSSDVARALKRVLRSQQNELLDAARTLKVSEADVLLEGDETEIRIIEAVEGPVVAAWHAGRDFVLTSLDEGGPAGPPPSLPDGEHAAGAIAREHAAEVVRAIRGRLGEGIDALRTPGGEREVGEDGLGDLVGIAYRDWKGTKVDRVAGDFALSSFASGSSASAAALGMNLRWVLENGQPCSDCDDNALSGPLAPGDAFPTGQTQPPLHPGCRCMLIAVPS